MEAWCNFSRMMKRKELDDVNDDFSDFSLSSPARKIRRLDAELPPIIEEEEPEISIELEQPELEQSFGSSTRRGLIIEELPSVPENEERALVVFKPLNTRLMHSPSNVSVSVDPRFVSGFKNELLWPKGTNTWRSTENEPREQDKESDSRGNCLAVVPWIPPQFPSVTGGEAFSQTDSTDMMEAEEMEGATMDIEDGGVGMDQITGLNTNEGLHQWQQHCMIPQPPQNISPPLVWYR